jgi:hypothetical protein
MVLITSCMVGPDYHTPKAKLADQYTDNHGKPANIADAYW